MEEKRISVSVIVPVYNIENCLARCIDSLLFQSIKEIEILLVDDGSTDSSNLLCDRYAEKDTRIKVFHKRNGGLSSARNLGIDKASGEYLMFVDSDDWVETGFCDTAYRLAVEKEADIVFFSYRVVYGKNEKTRRLADNISRFFQKSDTKDAEILYTNSIGTLVWNKIYRKELFDGIRFPEGHVYEDIGTTYKLIHASRTIYYSEAVLYNYIKRNGSISDAHTRKTETDRYELALQKAKDLLKWGYNITEDKLMWYPAYNYLKFFGNDGEYSKQCDEYLKRSKAFKKTKSFKRRLLIYIYQFFPPAFFVLCRFGRKRSD